LLAPPLLFRLTPLLVAEAALVELEAA